MTSFRLKVIAIIAMTLDHAAKIIGQAGLLTIFPNASVSVTYDMIHIMQGLGRLAFPLFAFMIAEGCRKTHSMPRYIGRLSLFALISEPFYYFAFRMNMPNFGLDNFLNLIIHLNLTNVFFTLALGAAAIYIYQLLERKNSKKLLLLFIPAFLVILYLAGRTHCDYGIAGVLLIVALYFARTKKMRAVVIAIWAVGLYILYQADFGFNWSQVWTWPIVNCVCASLAGALIWFYNGERGRPMKWCFYIYYPAHLLLLSLISVGLSRINA